MEENEYNRISCEYKRQEATAKTTIREQAKAS